MPISEMGIKEVIELLLRWLWAAVIKPFEIKAEREGMSRTGLNHFVDCVAQVVSVWKWAKLE
jgi:hypothetical protein